MTKIKGSHVLTLAVGLAVGAVGHANVTRTVAGLTPHEASALLSEIQGAEGWRACAYDDTLGNATIGYGILLPLSQAEQDSLSLPALPDCIDRKQGRWLLAWRVNSAANAFEGRWPAFSAQGSHVRAALLDAAYQLGPNGLASFRGALTALQHGQCDAAIHGFQASRWAHQTPSRVDRLVQAINEDCA